MSEEDFFEPSYDSLFISSKERGFVTGLLKEADLWRIREAQGI